MKKIFAILCLMAALSACYEDYILDFDYNAVYFPYQHNVRTFVVGEGMKIEVGISLGGVRENIRDRVVDYQLDGTLINAEALAALKSGASYIKTAIAPVTELQQLPSNYYTVSDNNKFILRKGEHSGTVTIRPDSARFLADAATLVPTFAIPFRITNADADSVLVSKDFAVIAVKYENMLFGNYWHGGVTIEKDVSGNIVSEKKYYTSIPSPDSKAWTLKTVEPFALVTNGVSDISSSSKAEFKITLDGPTITITPVEGATYQVQPDGESTFNQAKLLQNRKVFLNYKYQNAAGNWCYARDTLTFRNRIRDGINEWQDENPAHYK
ncbi:MAG TPA: DUF1735 domain-containing protein [Prolixibacteraceae bacterium]|nr:DUF1735 domain-containing protein [Prolixibacteraceae bacterium]